MRKIALALCTDMLKLPVAILSAALFLAPSTAIAEDTPVKCEASRKAVKKAINLARGDIEKYEGKIAEQFGSAPVHGFSIAVSMCGKTVWSEGFGYADLENMAPVSVETKFRIGSVSKTLTSAALGKLAESGRLDLDAEVQTYVPDFPRKSHPITVRQVAGNLAGIREYQGDEFFSTVNYQSVRDSLEIFEDDPLVHEPETAYLYSSYGWNLLSAVIEGAAGTDYLSYMQDRVFGPAGMTATTADKNTQIIPHRTRFYHIPEDETQNTNAPYVDNSNKWASGGFLSTPADLMAFANAITNETFINADTFAILTASQETRDGDPTHYGLGWATDMLARQAERAAKVYSQEEMDRIKTVIGDARVIGHTGGSVGGMTWFLMIPNAPGDVAVAAVSNNSAIQPVFALPVMARFLDAAKGDTGK